MIAKITKGKGFKGVLAYLVDGKKASATPRGQVIVSNMVGNTPKTLAREFGQLRSLRAGLNKAVFHASISLSPEDRGLDDLEFSDIAQQFLGEMGYQDCPFVVVRHHDTEHQHIHIVASRITVQGEVVSDAHDYRRAEAVMRQLEEDYGLHPPAERMVTNNQNKGDQKMKSELRERLNEALEASSNVEQFISECHKRGINPLPHIQGKRMQGMAFRFKRERYKGSDLGKKYAWQFLSVALNFNSDSDLDLLQSVKDEEEDNTPQVSPLEADNKKRREMVRKLLDEEYEAMLRQHFGNQLVDLTRTDAGLSITLNNGIRLTDHGDRISGENSGELESAKAMVELAKAKGWQSVSLTGKEDFLKQAMAEALKAGLEVVPKNDWQTELLEEVKRTVQASVPASQVAAAVEADILALKVGQMRQRFGLPDYNTQETGQPTYQPPKPKLK